MEKTTLAQRLTSRRKELKLSREDLATATGVTVAAVQAWESGSTKNLKLDHLFAVADALNVSPRWLATGRGPKVAAETMDAYSTALARRDEANSDEKRKGWERIAAVFARATAVVLLGFATLFASAPAEAAFNISADFLHIASQRIRKLFAWRFRVMIS